jgi:2-polyprenyl-3-methyl-5-hydroxy-6-metoxy-1,4-benzoquinol methylase
MTIDLNLIDTSNLSEETKVFLDLLKSNDWAEAVPTLSICENTEEDKLIRGEGIIDYLNSNLENKKILDFGCGEGHAVFQASKVASKSVGYDLVQSGNLLWEIDDKYLLTTDFDKVIANGPYDAVILYDVLDHCSDPVNILKKMHVFSTKQTEIFVRCHSWMSRHGSHLYKQINKAWIHVFLTEMELQQFGCKMDFVRKYYFPLNEHRGWFTKSDLRITFEEISHTTVEPFFQRSEFTSRIPKEFNGEFPTWQLSQSFNDYVLRT